MTFFWIALVTGLRHTYRCSLLVYVSALAPAIFQTPTASTPISYLIQKYTSRGFFLAQMTMDCHFLFLVLQQPLYGLKRTQCTQLAFWISSVLVDWDTSPYLHQRIFLRLHWNSHSFITQLTVDDNVDDNDYDYRMKNWKWYFAFLVNFSKSENIRRNIFFHFNEDE